MQEKLAELRKALVDLEIEMSFWRIECGLDPFDVMRARYQSIRKIQQELYWIYCDLRFGQRYER